MTALSSAAQAASELAERDPVMAGLVAGAGPCTLRRRRGGRGHFEALAHSIVFQQLAGRAADAIWRRVRALVPGSFTAAAVLALPEEALRGAGLSGAKARSLVDLAERAVAGDVRLDRLGRASDDAVVAELSRVRGIGRWTAEMFLMFQLGRLDVWPTGDLGVRKGYALAYSLSELPPPAVLEGFGEAFRPWRSVAAWYCWRAVDTFTPGTSGTSGS